MYENRKGKDRKREGPKERKTRRLRFVFPPSPKGGFCPKFVFQIYHRIFFCMLTRRVAENFEAASWATFWCVSVIATQSFSGQIELPKQNVRKASAS